MQPIFNQEQSNLNSQLAAQGITQGSTASDNAQNLFSRNINDAYNSAFANSEANAFNQSVESYQLPIQTLSTLLGQSQPGTVSSSLTNTPQEQIQPANYEALAQQDYQSQLQNYQNSWSGIAGIGSALAGGWMMSDRRAKKDIARVGSLYDGTPIYRFRYSDGPEAMHIGVMAQDILADKPEAVFIGGDGLMMVDYERATDRARELAHE